MKDRHGVTVVSGETMNNCRHISGDIKELKGESDGYMQSSVTASDSDNHSVLRGSNHRNTTDSLSVGTNESHDGKGLWRKIKCKLFRKKSIQITPRETTASSLPPMMSSSTITNAKVCDPESFNKLSADQRVNTVDVMVKQTQSLLEAEYKVYWSAKDKEQTVCRNRLDEKRTSLKHQREASTRHLSEYGDQRTIQHLIDEELKRDKRYMLTMMQLLMGQMEPSDSPDEIRNRGRTRSRIGHI